MLHVQHGFKQIFLRSSAQRRREITEFEVLMTTWTFNFILYFHPEISRTNSFLGYYANNVCREKGRMIAKSTKVIFWGDIFVDVAVADLIGLIERMCPCANTKGSHTDLASNTVATLCLEFF